MKLPEDKNERMKILALVFIGAAGVLYAAVQLGIAPLLAAKREKADRITELTESLALARTKAGQIRILKEQNRKVIAELVEISDEHILRRRLGNLKLGAEEVIERSASAAGVNVLPLRELGVSEIPGGATAKRGRGDSSSQGHFKVYGVQIDVVGGLQEMIQLLKQIESVNPCLCISGLSIEAQPSTPAVHKMWVEVQWPIWADPLTPDEIAEQLKEMEEPEPVSGQQASTAPVGGAESGAPPMEATTS